MASPPKLIRRRALRLVQDPEHPLYLFALRPDELMQLADISRVSRDNSGDLIGYQRPEVKKHVASITEYLDSSPSVLFPHALILALDSSATFQAVRGPRTGDGVGDAGTLAIRLPRNGAPKPAWIVDGQQRAIAVSRAKRNDLMIPVAAFVADDVETQREQFLRVNTTRPLPRGLVSELLPKVNSLLPPNLAARRAPSALVELMNTTPGSPFHGLIKRSSSDKAARKKAVVTDTALISALTDSLQGVSGCLFSYRNLATGETDYHAVLRLLLVYWTAVKQTFPEAWGKSPAQSRLMHGAGIRAMSKLMDRMMGSIDADSSGALDAVKSELALIKPVCRWTSGEWEDLGLRWNELQNLPNHIRVLSNLLLRAYLTARREGR